MVNLKKTIGQYCCVLIVIVAWNVRGEAKPIAQVPEKILENEKSSEINTFEQLVDHFNDPPAEYRPMPFWVWNDKVTKEKIDEDLQNFKIIGTGGVFIHPRMGLITPYLSEEWHDLYLYAVEKGNELGIQINIYDENAFPSGFAGGHVAVEFPDSYQHGNGFKLEKMKRLPENLWEDYEIVLKKSGSQFDLLSPRDQINQTGDYYLFKKTYYEQNDPWYGWQSYVDLLYPGVTEKFLDLTYTGYQDVIGKHFGKTVTATFSDEMRIRPTEDNSIRWTPDLFQEFKKRWGYDLKNKLPQLLEEVGDNWREVRHNYYSLLGEMFVERWAEPYNEFAEKNKLSWTGHYFEHDWPSPKNGGDWTALAARQHIPGVDLLFNEYDEKAVAGVSSQLGNARGMRELSSVANQMGRKRAISETYGASGWNLSFEDMKRIGDWQFVLGVNFLNLHQSFMTIAGARKRDYPPSFSKHEPWWHLYGFFTDYYGRLSMALSAGEQVNTTLVLAPTTSAWMYHSPVERHENFYSIASSFQAFTLLLEKNHIEYDIGSEKILMDFGQVNNSNLTVGERQYNLIVIPPLTESIDRSTLQLLKAYLDEGGEILLAGDLPSRVDGKPSDEVKELYEGSSNLWIRMNQSPSKEILLEQLGSTNFEIENEDKGLLFHRRMQFDDGEIIFLVNTSKEEEVKGKLNINNMSSVVELNAKSGEVVSYPSKQKELGLEVNFQVDPVGELLLYVRHGDLPTEKISLKPKLFKEAKAVESKGEMEIKRMKPNVLTLDYADIWIDGKKVSSNEYVVEAGMELFKKFGINHGNPWHRAVQYKENILDRNSFPENSNVLAKYYFGIEGLDEIALNSVKVAFERTEIWEISINGNKVEPVTDEWWLDRNIGIIEIGKYLQEGENVVELKVSPMHIHAELEPIYILGEFALESKDKGWKIKPEKSLDIGFWKEQGLPFYPWDVVYTQTFSIPSPSSSRFFVELGELNGTVASVEVNDQEVGLIGWPPYELDVTDAVQPGKNKISIRIIGSLKNLLGPHHGKPLHSEAKPAMFMEAPKNQPKGEDYDVLPYGLRREFTLVKKSY